MVAMRSAVGLFSSSSAACSTRARTFRSSIWGGRCGFDRRSTGFDGESVTGYSYQDFSSGAPALERGVGIGQGFEWILRINSYRQLSLLNRLKERASALQELAARGDIVGKLGA